MLGCWFYSTRWNKYVQIYGSLLAVMARCGEGHYIDEFDLEPIELTEELFEKLGFEKSYFPCYTEHETHYWMSKDKRIEIRDTTNRGEGYWYVHVDNSDFETIGGLDVRYLHEMHMFLSLCDYKLNMNLI